MNTKAQTTLIIVTTLLIGVVIGALGSGALRGERTRTLVQMPPRDRFQEAMERIIDPTPEQQQIIEGILARHAEEVSALHENLQQQIFVLFDSLQIELNSVLTEEQKARMKEQMLRGPRRFVRNRMDRLKDELNLSETQMQQMDEIMSSFEPMPLPRAREDGMKREGRRQFMRDRIFEMEQKVEEILTPEQMEKYRQMRARRYYMRPRGAERPSPSFDFPMPEPPE
jgi:hypothetical protein